MAEARPRPKVFSIPPGIPFLETLADAFLSGALAPLDRSDPLAIAAATVLLPTRRAVRAFREVLIERIGGEAAILPTIRPIGDVDEEDHLLTSGSEQGADRLTLPPAISPLARQLALTRLTLEWGRLVRRELLDLKPDEPLLIPASAADATRLAADLARLLDDMETHGIGWDTVLRLVPEDHAGHFQITLDFLRILVEQWPLYLTECGVVDPIARRDGLIRANAERLKAAPPTGPVIAAGSTGSIPATAELLKVIAYLPRGAVVLPGLDRALDASGWDAIDGGGDPSASAWGNWQFGLKQLIGSIGVLRQDVEPLGVPEPAIDRRNRLLSEAMRPAETVDAWAQQEDDGAPGAEEAFAGAALCVAHNEQEEALAIAIAIREAIEKPGTTAAVITPDRALARRIGAELGRWGLEIDDSAGTPLDRMPAGVFARLLADAAFSPFEPLKLLALLKHPLAAFGMDRRACRRAARILEIALFRGRMPPGGIVDIGGALTEARRAVEDDTARHVPRAKRRLHDRDWGLAAVLAYRISDCLGPIAATATRTTLSTAELAQLLANALQATAADETGGADALWTTVDGEALAALIDGLIDSAESAALVISPVEVPFFLDALMAGIAVQPPAGSDPRIHIWGTLEGRLQSANLLILAGLDESIWPADVRTDPWLSRAMRADIGLPPPERRLGLAAHDFVLGLSAPRVIVTRAEKRSGAPAVESRWLQRLSALLGEEAMAALRDRGDQYVQLARALDWVKTADVRPVKQPEPAPPLDARPQALPVTDIETLIRDPYAIYAKRILKLEPLESLALAPDYALRGSLIHEALGRFTQTFRGAYDIAAENALVAIGRQVLAEIEAFPDVHAIWSIRFEAIARWLVGWERQRSPEIAQRHAEIEGEIEIATPAGVFRLNGRADRIDLRQDGRLEVLDYKTGSPPSATQVLVGFAPQLALEAAMARRGGFDDSFADRSVANLAWIGLSRVGRDEPLKSAVERGHTADAVAETAFARLEALVAAYGNEARGYLSRARPMFETRYESPYDHLARVREWGLVESEEDLSWAYGPPAP